MQLGQGLQKLFYFLNFFYQLAAHSKNPYTSFMFISFPYETRTLKATEGRLKAIMRAARLGLKGDRLAIAAGMLPAEYRQLCQFDPVVEYAELKARTETEMELSEVLHEAAKEGDAKVALEILKHQHEWVAKQQVQIDVEQRISITDALEQASKRVALTLDAQDVSYTDVPSVQLTDKEKLKAA